MATGTLPDVATIQLHCGVDKRDAISSTLLFFITGNPGLIGYYTSYLQTLNLLLDSSATSNSVHIQVFGKSLLGFSDDISSLTDSPYSLEKQIEVLHSSLTKHYSGTKDKDGKPFDRVVLVGHSVGSYMLLEIIRRNHMESKPLNIAAGILLFPTITHIAQSTSGLLITKLFRWRDSPKVLGVVLQRVLSFCPAGVLVSLVSLITRMPGEFAQVTAGFLTSKIGIWQALYVDYSILIPCAMMLTLF